MLNAVIIIILVFVLILAVRGSVIHMRGEGNCCGGAHTRSPHKKLTGRKLGEQFFSIDGMHCKNCKDRIEKRVNELQGVACKVNLRKKLAKVSYSLPLDRATIKDAIEELGYKVTVY